MSVGAPAWIGRDEMLFSPLLERLGVVAGFTTRAQGSMAGSVYPLEEQARNREALARRLRFHELVRLKQVHGSAVVRVDRATEPWPIADAMWTDRVGLLLGVAAADCVPILVADGADPRRLVASLGPSIGPCCYTVDAARAEALREMQEHLIARNGQIAFDLWGANAAQLRESGVGEIEIAGICTKSGGQDLWSYRARDERGRYGTQLGFIGRRAE